MTSTQAQTLGIFCIVNIERVVTDSTNDVADINAVNVIELIKTQGICI
jgi:hypothetical protein